MPRSLGSKNKKTRLDSLPENTTFVDRGCEYSPRLADGTGGCLVCPLPVCRFDVAGGVPRIKTLLRDRELVAARSEGSAKELAERFGISRRSVFHAIARAATAPEVRI